MYVKFFNWYKLVERTNFTEIPRLYVKLPHCNIDAAKILAHLAFNKPAITVKEIYIFIH